MTNQNASIGAELTPSPTIAVERHQYQRLLSTASRADRLERELAGMQADQAARLEADRLRQRCEELERELADRASQSAMAQRADRLQDELSRVRQALDRRTALLSRLSAHRAEGEELARLLAAENLRTP